MLGAKHLLLDREGTGMQEIDVGFEHSRAGWSMVGTASAIKTAAGSATGESCDSDPLCV